MEGAAGGHRVAGVHGQVHEHLLDLRGIRLDPAERPRHVDVELHVLAERPPEDRAQALEQVGDVDGRARNHLVAAEHEQLAGEPRRAVRGALDLLGVRAQRVGVVEPVHQEARVALDHREEVVEVVRDPAGELPDALEALRLAELSLEALPLRHVAAVQHDAPEVGVLELSGGLRLDLEPRAVGGAHAPLDRGAGRAVECNVGEEVLGELLVVRVDQQRERGALEAAVRGVERPLHRGAGVHDLAVRSRSP